MTDYTTMTKFQLRAACRTAGIRNASKMTNDQMRAALSLLPPGKTDYAREYEAEPVGDDATAAIDAKRNDVPAGTGSFQLKGQRYGRLGKDVPEVSGDLYARHGRDNVPAGTVDHAAIATVCRLPERVLFPQSSAQDQTDAERFLKLNTPGLKIAQDDRRFVAEIPDEYMRQHASQRVVNNTSPKNRKGRKVPSQIRTVGRARRWHARHPNPYGSLTVDLTAASV